MTYAVNNALKEAVFPRENIDQSLMYSKIRQHFEETSSLIHANDPYKTRPTSSGHGKWKNQIRSFLLYSSMLICAALVGHALTLACYLSNFEHISPNRSMTKQKKTKKAIQAYADMEKRNNLDIPCLQSELYYNISEVGIDDFTLLRKNVSPPPRPPPTNCEATVVLIRHCEKSSLKEHCSSKGLQRAEHLANLFGHTVEEKWPAPSYLFALNPGERHNKYIKNWREIETIQPLSKKISVPINSSFGLNDSNGLSDHIFKLLKSGKLCDHVALISWKHDDLPRLAHSLGCGPSQGCPSTFDSIDFDSTWQISYSYHKDRYAPYIVEDPKAKKEWGLHPQWWVSSTIIAENFDPLAWSKRKGKYEGSSNSSSM